jgi:hypothetical protein
LLHCRFAKAHQAGVPLASRKDEQETMNPETVIRSETNEDIGAIAEVTIAAFRTLEISNHTEQFIIEALRAAQAVIVSLVAEVRGRVVGHIAFSPVTISDGTQNWYGLGPVSVLPGEGRILILYYSLLLLNCIEH